MANKKIPLRKCVGCGCMKEKTGMVRVIKTAEGEILLDATGKKNGRGAYVCNDPSCLQAAVKSRGLERSLRTAVPGTVYEELKKEMDALANQ